MRGEMNVRLISSSEPFYLRCSATEHTLRVKRRLLERALVPLVAHCLSRFLKNLYLGAEETRNGSEVDLLCWLSALKAEIQNVAQFPNFCWTGALSLSCSSLSVCFSSSIHHRQLGQSNPANRRQTNKKKTKEGRMR